MVVIDMMDTLTRTEVTVITDSTETGDKTTDKMIAESIDKTDKMRGEIETIGKRTEEITGKRKGGNTDKTDIVIRTVMVMVTAGSIITVRMEMVNRDRTEIVFLRKFEERQEKEEKRGRRRGRKAAMVRGEEVVAIKTKSNSLANQFLFYR